MHFTGELSSLMVHFFTILHYSKSQLMLIINATLIGGKTICPCSLCTKSSDFKLITGVTVICGFSMLITGLFTSIIGVPMLSVGCTVIPDWIIAVNCAWLFMPSSKLASALVTVAVGVDFLFPYKTYKTSLLFHWSAFVITDCNTSVACHLSDLLFIHLLIIHMSCSGQSQAVIGVSAYYASSIT